MKRFSDWVWVKYRYTRSMTYGWRETLMQRWNKNVTKDNIEKSKELQQGYIVMQANTRVALQINHMYTLVILRQASDSH